MTHPTTQDRGEKIVGPTEAKSPVLLNGPPSDGPVVFLLDQVVHIPNSYRATAANPSHSHRTDQILSLTRYLRGPGLSPIRETALMGN